LLDIYRGIFTVVRRTMSLINILNSVSI
jgi:hypothetical protein